MNVGPLVVRSLALVVVLAGAHRADAADDAVVKRGQAVYQRHCAPCHDPGPGHPGTQMLAAVKGEQLAVLIGRSDLSEDVVRAVVRNGLIEMPPFRPSEVTDDDLKALVTFIHAQKRPSEQ